MRVIVGPPGAGKSTAFPVAESGLDFFDADRRAAELNGGFKSIPLAIRSIVNREFEAFIDQHIAERRSLTFETTLRSAITLEQAQRALQAGFFVMMTYVALDSVELHIERVAMRADHGGHSAPAAKIREIYAASLANFSRALVELDDVTAFDNTGTIPELCLVCQRGIVKFLKEPVPEWVRLAAQTAR